MRQQSQYTPIIPIYAEDIEWAYTTVQETYPLSVAVRKDEDSIIFFNDGSEVAYLFKDKHTPKLDWFRSQEEKAKDEHFARLRLD